MEFFHIKECMSLLQVERQNIDEIKMPIVKFFLHIFLSLMGTQNCKIFNMLVQLETPKSRLARGCACFCTSIMNRVSIDTIQKQAFQAQFFSFLAFFSPFQFLATRFPLLSSRENYSSPSLSGIVKPTNKTKSFQMVYSCKVMCVQHRQLN